MSFFKNLSTDGLEKQEDRLGGGGLWDTGAYNGRVKMAYVDKYKSGAQFIALTLVQGSKEYRQQILITNAKGENFYTKDDKKLPLMGFSMIDSLCLITTGQPLSAQEVEDKVVKIFNYETKKEVPTSVPVLVDLLDKEITFTVEKQLGYKQAKNAQDMYVDTTEEQEKNELQKFFDTETKLTVTEAEQGMEEGAFYHKWLAANVENGVGKVRDRRKGNGGGATAGKPPVAGAAPSGATAGPPKKALFGKKS